jgi:peptidoglycan/LPS O-acetylase OafA/YrhL
MSGGKLEPRANRFAVLDALRGLGSMQVVVFHYLLTMGQPLLKYWFVYNSWVSLDFFFVLSGFVIAHVYVDKLRDWRSVAGFAVRRFGRIWPLHIAVLGALVLFVGTINIALPHQSWLDITRYGQPFSYMSLITEVLLLNAMGVWEHFYWNVPSWSMGAELNVYVIFALVCLVARRAIVIASVAMAAVALTALALWSPRYLSADIDMGIFRCMAGFFCGVISLKAHAWMALRWPSLMDLRKTLAGTLVEVLAFAIIITFVYNLDAFGQFSLLSFASPVLFGLLVLVFSFACGHVSFLLDRPIFHRLGDLSYSVYVTHWPLLIAIWYALWVVKEYLGVDLWWYLANSRLYSFLGFFPLAAVVLLVSSFTFRAVEVPWRARFAVIGRRIEGAPASRSAMQERRAQA